jgi:multiple sugar transport system ATP-binding protein
MSVAQNLGFGLRMRGVSKNSIEKRIIETAEILGIEKLLNRKPKELSGGQQQRVAMGRALVRRPKLFLLDEPLSNLDARLRVNVRLELKSLHQQIKATIVYVTHDQVEAMSLGDKVVVMREGEVHQIDRPEFIYDQPADTFVASFIGSPVINLFSGRLTRFEGRLAFQTKDFCLNLGDMDWNFEHSDLEIGIRPEDIRVVHRPDSALKGVVEMITNVGAEKYVYSRMGSTSFTVRAPKSAILKPGEVIYLGIDPSTFHFFYSEKRVHTRMQLDRLTTNFERY